MKTVVEFKKVSKSFGDKQIFKEVSFEIREGEIVFVLGTSGTGKSVLLKSIVGLLEIDSGQIWISGQDITNYSEEQMLTVRRECGMVFQQPALFDSLTIFENVVYGARRFRTLNEGEYSDLVKKCLKAVRLEEIESKFPNEISYGMQKRVSLARTLAVSPKILLFDEPTTGLDPLTTGSITRLIRDLSRNLQKTTIVVSHDMHSALEIADRIFVLDQGEIVAQGTPTEIMKSTHPLVRDFMEEIREVQA